MTEMDRNRGLQMYNSWSGPVAHHKARAGGHDADYLHAPPCRELQGTLSTYHTQGRSARGFANPDVAANSGNWASLNSDGSSVAITPLSLTPCTTQVMTSAQDRISFQAPSLAQDRGTSQAPSSALVMSTVTAISGGVDRANEDFDDLVRQMWDEHLRGLDATTAAAKR